jgi:hypothetical protein
VTISALIVLELTFAFSCYELDAYSSYIDIAISDLNVVIHFVLINQSINQFIHSINPYRKLVFMGCGNSHILSYTNITMIHNKIDSTYIANLEIDKY